MSALISQTDERTLSALGEEASALLMQREYGCLAARFGYALAYGREPEAAIEADYLRAVSAPLDAEGDHPVVSVVYFKPNPLGLLAMIECTVPVAEKAAIRLELMVTETGNQKHVTLEEISGLLCCPAFSIRRP